MGGFHPPQRSDQVGVTSGKTNPPAGHVVGLGHGRELDRDVRGAGNFQHRRRRVAVKIHLGVGKVGEDVDAVPSDFSLEILKDWTSALDQTHSLNQTFQK